MHLAVVHCCMSRSDLSKFSILAFVGFINYVCLLGACVAIYIYIIIPHRDIALTCPCTIRSTRSYGRAVLPCQTADLLA